MYRVWRRREEHGGVLWGNRRKTDHLEYLGVRGRIILEGIYKFDFQLKCKAIFTLLHVQNDHSGSKHGVSRYWVSTASRTGDI